MSPDLPAASSHPVFAYDGRELVSRFNQRHIFAGYDLMDEALHAPGREAIEALHAVMTDPAHHTDFNLEAGQLVYFLNGRCAHRRTAYEDWPESTRRRHMVRIFLRDEGARTYDG